MIQKSYTSLLCLALTISSCSLLPTKKVEIVSKPIEIDIMQPDLPRPVELTAPQWWVVSNARITNPCIKRVQDDGSMKTDGSNVSPTYYSGGFAAGDIIGMAVNVNDNQITFYKP